LRDQHLPDVGLLVLTVGLVMPALDIGLTLYLLAVLRVWPRRRCFPLALRLLHAARPWSMIDVLVLGTLVALGRLGQSAHVVVGAGLGASGAFMLAMGGTRRGFDSRELAAGVTGRRTGTDEGGASRTSRASRPRRPRVSWSAPRAACSTAARTRAGPPGSR